MLCDIHGTEMDYDGEGSYIGQDIWVCQLCENEYFDLLEDHRDDQYADDSAAGFDDGIDGRTIYKNHQPPEVLPVISWLEDDDDDDDEIQEYDGRPIVNRYDPPFEDY